MPLFSNTPVSSGTLASNSQKHLLLHSIQIKCSIIERSMLIMLSDEYRYKIFKLVEAKPEISQREIARDLGISLGKANYCLKALIEKGMIKANNFRNSKNKLAYAYKLTPKGIEEKASVTVLFLKRKMDEYQKLQHEIDELRQEASAQRAIDGIPTKNPQSCDE